RQGERRHAVEAWHREVRQDDVGGELAQRADEPLLRVRDAVRDAQPGAFQLAQLQLGVGRIVLSEQQPEHRDVRLRAGHQWMNLLREANYYHPACLYGEPAQACGSPHHNNALPSGLLDKTAGRSIQNRVPPADHAVPNDLALLALAPACSAGRAEDGAAASSVIRVPRARGAREHLTDAIPDGGADRGPRSRARSLLGDLPAFREVGFVARHVAALGIDNGA